MHLQEKFARRRWARALLAGALALAGAQAGASGSIAPGGAMTDQYEFGKAVFTEKLGCSQCPFAGKPRNATEARQVVDELMTKADANRGLSPEERDAAIAYVKRRYRL
jgi:hypothetical protein